MSSVTQIVRPQIDLTRYELRVQGARVKLERQPMDLLILLVQRRGQLVTREDIIEKLWGKDVFVDVEGSINRAVRKIRSALRDDPSQPQYLETVVGKGYRFVGDVEIVENPPISTPADTSPQIERIERTATRSTGRIVASVAAAILLISAGLWIAFRGRETARATGPQIRSIAVLPLANLSGDQSQDYFADGMTDELTTDLAKVGSLKVISRTSAQRYRATNKSVKQIAKELGVEAVVEGSVSKSKDRVRVTAQLIDAVNDRHLWAESYDRDLGDALAVQNTVALEIARQVRTKLTSFEQQRLQTNTPVDRDAYDAYLRGRYSQTTQSTDGLKEGLTAFQRSITLDANFAPAYAGLADSYSLLANYAVLNPSEAFPQAEAAAKKALELDPNSAEAHTAIAYLEHHYTWQWAEAEREYKAAISLSPSYPTSHLRYAEYLSSVGRHDEAIAETHRAFELDPLSLTYLGNLGRFLYHARRYDEAIEVLKKTLALDPNRTYVRMHLAMCYEQKGMYSEAAAEIQKVGPASAGTAMAHIFATSGKPAEARKLVTTLRDRAGDSNWFFISGAYAALGDRDNAFACLQQAYKKHDFFLVFLKVHPYMDPLRSDPRYADLVHRIGMS